MNETIFTTISIIATVVTSIASLGYWLGKKFAIIDERFSRIDERINRLEKAFTQFSETLIMVLEYKGVFTSIEAASFRGLIKALLPSPSSKYYTREVYERLKQLLDKDPNDYTMADIDEMNKIADLIEKEGKASNREDLIDYSYKLRFYAMIAKVVYIYPKLRKT